MSSIRIRIVMIFSLTLAIDSIFANKEQCSNLSSQTITNHELYQGDKKLLAEQSSWSVFWKNLIKFKSSGDDLTTDNISANLCACGLSKVQNRDYNDYSLNQLSVQTVSIAIRLFEKIYTFSAIRCICDKLINSANNLNYYIIKSNFNKGGFLENRYDVYLVHSTIMQDQFPVDIILKKVPLYKFNT